ncbi:MAG: hypothetical protein Q9198_001076 [Flavoplaca austrocitrina]
MASLSMEHISITNLEAELGFLDWPSSSAGPRYDHGDPHKPLDAPAGSTSYLRPPSKTESFYTFGANGTVAWTTAAGELLQVASCINNKLIGAEYRKNIQRGTDYEDRREMLEKAISAPQGSGYGIGLSLADPLEPVEKHWVHNRWPRYTYRHGALKIRLQYNFDASTVIQEYQVQNAGQEEVRLPYVYSSDICFREHWSENGQIYPVPTGKSPVRLLLFQNSKVLVTNHEHRCQISMALFLNAQRQTLWHLEDTKPLGRSRYYTEGPSKFSRPDKILRENILAGSLVDESTDSELKTLYEWARYHEPGIPHSSDVIKLASHSTSLVVPPGSTQELRAVIQPSALSESKQSESDPAPAPETDDHKEDRQRTSNNQVKTNKERLWSRQRALVYKSKQLSLKDSSQGARQLVFQFITDHLEVGKACSMLKLVGEARYHMFTAYLITGYLYKEDSKELMNARYVYSDFLYNHDWVATALEILEPLSHTLANHRPKAREFPITLEKVQNRLATMYLKTDNFSKAEKMSGHVLPHPIGDGTIPEPLSAHYLERQAWAQVQQRKFAAAYKNYHSDFGSPLFHSSSAILPMKDDGPFYFAMARHLETLLSSCCIRVENNEGIAGTAFLDANPLDSVHKGDNS